MTWFQLKQQKINRIIQTFSSAFFSSLATCKQHPVAIKRHDFCFNNLVLSCGHNSANWKRKYWTRVRNKKVEKVDDVTAKWFVAKVVPVYLKKELFYFLGGLFTSEMKFNKLTWFAVSENAIEGMSKSCHYQSRHHIPFCFGFYLVSILTLFVRTKSSCISWCKPLLSNAKFQAV